MSTDSDLRVLGVDDVPTILAGPHSIIERSPKFPSMFQVGKSIGAWKITKVLQEYRLDEEKMIERLPVCVVCDGTHTCAAKGGLSRVEWQTQLRMCDAGRCVPRVYHILPQKDGYASFMVMEMIPNILVEQKKAEERLLFNCGIGLVEALNLLHVKTGLLHFDVAPQNIGFRSDLTFVLMDFGCVERFPTTMGAAARILYAAAVFHMQGDNVKGPAVDFEALGYVLLEWCLKSNNSKLPWDGVDPENNEELLRLKNGLKTSVHSTVGLYLSESMCTRFQRYFDCVNMMYIKEVDCERLFDCWK